jgi:mRNA-degrading endonuclease RelE of RelBE toxin-antitoxin system
MFVFSIQLFRDSLVLLTKHPKEGYTSVNKDICTSINREIDEIRNNRDLIREEAKFRLIKLRIGNSGLKSSKSDGFRLIYIAEKNFELTVLCTVYPKRGARAKNNLTLEGIKSCLKEYIECRKNNTFVCHDMKDKLKPMTDCKHSDCQIKQQTCNIISPD